jgi:hypothetical protein
VNAARLAVAACLTAVVALTAGCGDDAPPYTHRQLVNADIECDADDLRAALVGTTSTDEAKGAVEDGFSSVHVDCLHEKLPALSDDQLAHFDDLVDAR